MNKRGQFYIIAAVILVIVVISLISIENYMKAKDRPERFYDLGNEIKEESSRVVDYGIYQEVDVQPIITGFIEDSLINYIDEKDKTTNVIFVYGNRDSMTAETHTIEDIGSISVSLGEFVPVISMDERFVSTVSRPIGQGEDSITVNFNEINYEIKINSGENFFFIIIKDTEEETHISSNLQDMRTDDDQGDDEQ